MGKLPEIEQLLNDEIRQVLAEWFVVADILDMRGTFDQRVKQLLGDSALTLRLTALKLLAAEVDYLLRLDDTFRLKHPIFRKRTRGQTDGRMSPTLRYTQLWQKTLSRKTRQTDANRLLAAACLTGH
jgi:hypothetical protein